MILSTEMILEKTGETGSTTQNVPASDVEDLQLRFAGHILTTNEIDNLVWAKEFMDNYERSRKIRKTNEG